MGSQIGYKIIPDRSLVLPKLHVRSNITSSTDIFNGLIRFIAGENITEGDPVYIDDDLCYKADTVPAQYIALNTANTDRFVIVQNTGLYSFSGTNDTDLWNLDGVLSNIAPTKLNNFYQRLGHMISSDTALLNINNGVLYDLL